MLYNLGCRIVVDEAFVYSASKATSLLRRGRPDWSACFISNLILACNNILI